MKNLITLAFVLFLTTTTFGQNKTLEQVENNLYEFTTKDSGKVLQRGYYKIIDGKYKPHGFWKDYQFKTTAYFEYGTMMWIKPNGKSKYTYEEMELHRLKRKVEKLESIIALNDKP